ncbi:hypothetical protein [Leptolyngbya sp. FACHB-711]|uniref:hypothetical protein n=1 Tax=Leptolyngbya sp. FACHB-711 TaxID=2692813 RepID=UPI001686ABA6|nr:hypothetical protein [Leptolyngbya sp. FACHB-711]MBD2028233.1 hypothetical protein [Leptolyngbya sp. FACHB-711]
MLVEYALIPNIFAQDCYSSPDLCEARLQILKPILMEEALVRDLHGGEWWNYLKNWMSSPPEQCHPKAKELLKKIQQKKRIRKVAFCGPNKPDCHAAWFDEALASHNWEELTAIVALREIAQQHEDKKGFVTSIDKLNDFQRRGSSIELLKQSSSYLKHLRLLLSHANSILFIDPYLDPTQPRYQEFHFLLECAKRRDISPLIEFHVAAKGYDSAGNDRSRFSQSDWKSRFSRLNSTLNESGLEAEVFVWEYFHDRYIISDLLGISLSSGLDVVNGPTTWSRLPSKLRDKIQGDFTQNSTTYNLKYQFELP